MSEPTVACLTVTNRPEWMPFCRRQVAKQKGVRRTHFEVSLPSLGIPALRNCAMRQVLNHEYAAWFDDDDWSSPDRLEYAVRIMEAFPQIMAVGNVRSWFISTTTRKAIEYQSPEGLIFNGAVFRTAAMPRQFADGLTVGEDTEWLGRFMSGFPTYLVRGTTCAAWLCHQKNVTNRLSTRTFELDPPPLMSEEDWRLVP